MSKGISLHIGVSKLKRGIYLEEAALSSPANDANAMADIAKQEGYESINVLVNENATLTNVIHYFDNCIEQLNSGDTFLLTYSGHGGQIDDTNNDEQDGKDEIWCLYDNYLIDDTLGAKWCLFKAGVRIIVVSSSCHSRTALRVWSDDCFSSPSITQQQNCIKDITQNEKSILQSYINDTTIKASILHLSACEDEQEARDGNNLSRFTGLLLKYLDNGSFTGNYEDLIKQIRQEAGYLQCAGIAQMGYNDPTFLNAIPFQLLTPKK